MRDLINNVFELLTVFHPVQNLSGKQGRKSLNLRGQRSVRISLERLVGRERLIDLWQRVVCSRMDQTLGVFVNGNPFEAVNDRLGCRIDKNEVRVFAHHFGIERVGHLILQFVMAENVKAYESVITNLFDIGNDALRESFAQNHHEICGGLLEVVSPLYQIESVCIGMDIDDQTKVSAFSTVKVEKNLLIGQILDFADLGANKRLQFARDCGKHESVECHSDHLPFLSKLPIDNSTRFPAVCLIKMICARISQRQVCCQRSQILEKGKIIVLSGPSGVGKGSVRKLLNMDELNAVNSVSMTTRAPRAEDQEGVTYFFVSPEEFQKTIDEDGFLEHAKFSGNCYGTPAKAVEEHLNKGENVLLEIEVQGAKQVMEKVPDACTIFLVPPTFEDLEKRIRNRSSETEEQIASRLEQAKNELSEKDLYKYVVVNDDLNEAAKQVSDIIQAQMKDANAPKER